MARLLTFLMRSLALNVIVNSELTRKKTKKECREADDMRRSQRKKCEKKVRLREAQRRDKTEREKKKKPK